MPQGKVRVPYLQANTPFARLALAEAGLGITAISAEHPGISETNLIQVLPEIEGPTVSNFYIYSKALQNSKKIKALEDYLLAAIKRDYGTP
jgi:DNA-binding transcriptional LysR family regulator